MLSVDIEKIIPVTGARDMFNKIVDDVEGSDELYVLTKNGKPTAVVVGVNHLEKLTGETSGEIMSKVSEATEEPKDDEEAPKPLENTPAADISKEETPAATSSTDAFSATPTTPAPTSSFNAAPAMPEENPAANVDPMAPVTDADGKTDIPEDNTANTAAVDPFAAPATPPANTPNSQNPNPGTTGDSSPTPPTTSN